MDFCKCNDTQRHGLHTKKEHVDGMRTRCGICGAPGHYTLAHDQWKRAIMKTNKPCGFCGEWSHISSEHTCSKCRVKGDHRGIYCHTVRCT